MCNCEPSFTCARCKGTPFDPAYDVDDVPPVSMDIFEDLMLERHYTPQMFGGEE